MAELISELRQGDCQEVLKDYPDNFFDLIITSPPYADRRKSTYGGISPNKYVAWFIERSEQFLRVLKPAGTFILNIKEKVENGERHTYVIELILAMRQQGWLWTEEFIWHKKNCHPGKWPNRFRDAWERCLQFNKSKKFTMYQENVMIPMGDWADKRLKKLGKNDIIRFNSQAKSGFGKNISNWIGRTMAYPTNVLYLPTETSNKNHSATFPKALPEWFVKLFTKEYDWILDPFVGSGTVVETAHELFRNSVGIDIIPEFIELAKTKVKKTEYCLFDSKIDYEKNKKD
ncbi:MAG: DNA methylase [Candidatus Fischerbacteria bacterium RBG_13_37_8]|uniref:Methyltransferase n=1 Tax=Candidatus Fischerbacteria bacterium RBG_13_37_8 TaxID=1817863 RepID=A0A1F5VXB6_9BACT|nr:MAG: DNA methylase [Candidatus Fischerbacteria bacterium RBG_13_37_8]